MGAKKPFEIPPYDVHSKKAFEEWSQLQDEIRQNLEEFLLRQDNVIRKLCFEQGERVRLAIPDPSGNGHDKRDDENGYRFEAPADAETAQLGDLLGNNMSPPVQPVKCPETAEIRVDLLETTGEVSGTPRMSSPRSLDPEIEIDRGDALNAPTYSSRSAWSLSQTPLELDLWRNRIRIMAMGLTTWWANLIKEPPRKSQLGRIITTPSFEMLCVFVIVANTVFTIISANMMVASLDSKPPPFLLGMERAFLVFYIFEVSARIFVHRLYFFVNNDHVWNNMDLFLVLISIWHFMEMTVVSSGGNGLPLNPSFLRVLRVLKVARILRLLRVIRFFRELRVLLDALLSSFGTLFWCVLLMVLTVATFALVFVQIVTDHLIEQGSTICAGDCSSHPLMKNFGSVERTMLSLYMATTGGNDWGYYWDMLAETGWGTLAIFLFYTVFYFFGIFNLLTGMFVDKATKASQEESFDDVVDSRVSEVKQMRIMEKICSSVDFDATGTLTSHEFETLLGMEKMSSFLQEELDMPEADIKTMYYMLHEISPQVPIKSFLSGCMRMRGNAASIDMQTLRFELSQVHRMVNSIYRRSSSDHHHHHHNNHKTRH